MTSASPRTPRAALLVSIVTLASLVPLASILLAPTPAQGAPASSSNEIAAAIEAQLDVTAAIPAAYGVIDGDEVITGTHGDGDVDQPFIIGSVSKSFTALAALTYVDDGSLDLDAAVTEYVPEFTLAEPTSEPLRVRHLLQHTTGLSFSECNADFATPLATIEERVRDMETAAPVHEPGTEFEYCNVGYALLAHVIERIGGAAYSDLLRERVLDPLGMHATYTDVESAERAGLAVAHQTFMGVPFQRPEEWRSGAVPDGYIISTVNDMLTYAAFHLGDGTTAAGERLVSAETLHEMHSPAFAFPGSEGTVDDAYGFGLFVGEVNGHRIVSHGGDTLGYHADLVMLPDEGRAAVILTAGQLFSGTPVVASGATAVLTGEPANTVPMYAIATASLWGLLILVIAMVVVSLVRSRRRRANGRVPRRWGGIANVIAGVTMAVGVIVLAWILGQSVGFGVVYLWRTALDALIILALASIVPIWIGIRAMVQRRAVSRV